jgi:hypothetical protein
MRCITVPSPGDYESWKYIPPIQKKAWLGKVFENAPGGGEIRTGIRQLVRVTRGARALVFPGASPTLIWTCSSQKHGIHQLIVIAD